MRHIAIGFLFVTFLAALAVMGSAQLGQKASASHIVDTVDLVAIDAVPTGNDDAHVGAIDSCVSIPLSGTVDVDLVIKGVRADTKILGYQFDIDYLPAVITVNSVNDVDLGGSGPGKDVSIISRINSTSGAGLISLSSIPAIPPNSFTVAAADGTADAFAHVGGVQGVPQMHEPGSITNSIDDDLFGGIDDADEASRDGVLARITITGASVGVSPLTIPSTLGGADGFVDTKVSDGSGSNGIPGDFSTIHKLRGATVAVGTPCPPSVANQYCISGTSTGIGWDWKVGSLYSGTVTVAAGGTAIQLATAWVNSMKNAGVNAGQKSGARAFCFSITPGGADPQSSFDLVLELLHGDG